MLKRALLWGSMLSVLFAPIMLAGCGGDDEVGPDQDDEEMTFGTRTPMVLLEDGRQINTREGDFQVSDHPDDPYMVVVEGYGEGWWLYRCDATGQLWPYGRDGQTLSPYFDPNDIPVPGR